MRKESNSRQTELPAAISSQPHDSEKKAGNQKALTGIHADRADARCLKDPEVWTTEVTPARHPSRRLALDV